ncbi:MAG TPA: ATP-binding protein [Anaerolineae bacterium]|nr:ATP-binding protein [Anaerolineae bacterium]
MTRLWVRLSLAFGVVVLVAVGVVALLGSFSATAALRYYVAYSAIMPHQNLVDALSTYYERQGSWQGAARVLDQVASNQGPAMMGMRRGMGGMMAGDVLLQFVLADRDGRVIYDGVEGSPGRYLTGDERAAAEPVNADGRVAGYLVVSVPPRAALLGPLEEALVTRLRRWLAVAGVAAGGLALLLGLGLSRSLTAPLQHLAAAARGIAQRDFSRRVEPEGSAELVEVALAFNEMAAALDESEQQRKNMVADVAHELRTPLSVLQGNLQALLDDLYPLDKAEVSRLYDETRLLSRLVDDLRDLALADAGQLSLNLRAMDAAALVTDVGESLGLAAEAQDVLLTLDLEENLPPVLADPDRLAQVLRNLVTNALRHTAPGGTVTLSARRDGAFLRLVVADNGEGIMPGDLAHVFDRFWRADRSRSRDGADGEADGRVTGGPGGSGLGLAIAQSLVQAHGGRIWAESDRGVGTKFALTIPLATQPLAVEQRAIVE